MLTIATIPKPFLNPHIRIIQINAIKSWLFLKPKPEIILYGDDEGIEDIAQELGVKHIPQVKKNEFGTPFLSKIFEDMEKRAKNDILCYVNCDIILFQDLIETLTIVHKKEKNYLILGQRWDYDQKELIEFKKNWEQELKEKVIKNGSLHPPAGSDYFIFKKGILKNMPDFTVGRIGWDNWFIEYFIKKRIKVINCSSSIFIIHQNHDYFHKKNNENDPEDLKNLKKFNKKNINIDLLYSLDDVLYFMENCSIVYRKTFKNFNRNIFRFILNNNIIFYTIKIILLPFKMIKKLIKRDKSC